MVTLSLNDLRFGHDLRRRIEQNLAGFAPRTIADPQLSPAAVVIAIGHGAGGEEACVVMTRRPAGLRRHAGQYALPGGRLDEGESPAGAALRELFEELRLTVDERDVLGTLDDYPTRSGFRIVPLVAWCGDLDRIEPDPAEVEAVFCVPMRDLLGPDIPHFEIAAQRGEPVMSAWLPSLADRVYAPTAALLYQFREVALLGRDTPVAHFGQPEFAWR